MFLNPIIFLGQVLCRLPGAPARVFAASCWWPFFFNDFSLAGLFPHTDPH